VVRAVSEKAFTSDALRLLRAVRLASELGFNISQETEAQIKCHAHLITGVAGERIREELLRLLAAPKTEQLLLYLDNLGLLTALISELAHTKGVEQPREHAWDVFNHSVKTAAAVDFVLRQGDWQYAGGEEVLKLVPWSAELSEHFNQKVSSGSTRRLLLKLAALLHDIAKPQTKIIDERGRTRFLGHPGEGAPIAAHVLERLRFSSKEVKLAAGIVRYHLRPVQMSRGELPSRRAIYRYFRDTGEVAIDTLFFSLADHLATRGPDLDMANWQEHTNIVAHVLSQRSRQNGVVSPPKLINGHDLISNFNLTPGPEIGKLLEAVCEAQASGEVSNREEALSYVKGLLTLRGNTTVNLPHETKDL
jgi:poly(A) polymerase